MPEEFTRTPVSGPDVYEIIDIDRYGRDGIADTLSRSHYDIVEPGHIYKYKLTNGNEYTCFIAEGDDVPSTYREYIEYYHTKLENNVDYHYFDDYNYFNIGRVTLKLYHNCKTVEGNVYNHELQAVIYKDDPIKKVKDDDEVELYTKDKATAKDCINFSKLGWVLKTDSNIKEDYLSNKPIFINEEYTRAIYGTIFCIYTSVDYEGNLINPEYTLLNPNLPYLISPRLDNDKITVHHYCTVNLTRNKTFLEYYIENVNDGKFYDKNCIRQKDLVKSGRAQYRKCKRYKSFRDSIANRPNTYIKMLGKHYTFGVEIESASGYFPKYLDDFIFYDAVHDGSLKDPESGSNYGAEYVSDVLWGDLGLQQLKMLSTEAAKRCTINKLCSVHLHLGNINFNKENIVLMYWLYLKLEDTLFNMMPISRRSNEYCRRLPELDINITNIEKNRDYYIDLYYNQIINILSQQGDASQHINKKTDHPKGFKCGYDHSAARYCWVNFIPSVFNTRRNDVYTLEFRLHSSTTSYIKIKNWLMICIGLVDIVENYKTALYSDPDISLQQIIELVYPKNHLDINSYIAKRTIKFSDHSLALGINQEVIDYTDNEIDTDISIKNL